ncbi:MAG TPA: HEAT repeat domain-containing protein, partial [Phycisphaerae bacterium]
MTSQEVIAALRAHDFNLNRRISTAPASLASDVAPVIAGLDPQARLILVSALVAHDGPGDGNLLLRLSSDDQQIAVGAAQGLVGMKNLPTAADILLALPKREDSMVREGLYLALGKTGDQGKLEDLRA